MTTSPESSATSSKTQPDERTPGSGSTRLVLLGFGLGLVFPTFLALLVLWQSQSAMRQLRFSPEWEYLVQSDSELLKTGGLVERGLEKWELVAVQGEQPKTYYFKRPKAGNNPATAKVIRPTSRWSGRIPVDLANKSYALVTGRKSWAALWKTFKQPGEVPAVDFSKLLILVGTTDGNFVDLTSALYRDGDLRITIRSSFQFDAGKKKEGGAFVIIAVPRDGVKTVDGKPIPPPNSEK
ncbi:MAG: hypothetical protein ACFCD0_23620 [Gemmataceae bacterium]